MNAFDESKVRRATDGKFAHKTHAEADGLSLRPQQETVWSTQNYDWEDVFSEDYAKDDLEWALGELNNYDPEHEGYLLVATANSRYGSIGLPGSGNGYKVAEKLPDALHAIGDLESIAKDTDGTMVIETANHDFTQKIKVYPLSQDEYDEARDADWYTQNEIAHNLDTPPLSFE